MPSEPPKSSHGQILKSSALIGGSSLVTTLVGMVRVKFTAVYLGTYGVGVFGAYSTILAPLSTLAGMGINFSGVRQIAEAAGQGDEVKIGRTLLTIRRVSWVTGLLGMVLLLALAYPLSRLTFHDSEHVLALCLLSVTLLLGDIAGGLGAIIQGMRRIRDLALQGILGSLIGLPFAIVMMMLWRVDAIVPMMLVTSVTGVFMTWWFARKIKVATVQLSWRETWLEARPLLQLGVVYMSTALVTAVIPLLQRIIIIRQLGVPASGLYGAAWSLSNQYIGFILVAIGADFYPRLMGVNTNHQEVNRLVNEQTEVGLLMAVPGVMATLVLAPLVFKVFYTADFMPAVAVLRWQVLGLVLRLIAWPMGFIMLAKGAKYWFFWTELAAQLASVALIWLGIHFYGLPGTGLAFFVLYLLYVLLMLFVSKRLTGFVWGRTSRRLIGWMTVLLTATMLVVCWLPMVYSVGVGLALTTASAWFALKTLTRLTGKNPLVAAWEKVRRLLPMKKNA